MGLLPGHFSPYVVQSMVRLGTMLPFERVPGQLRFQTGVHVALETVRRLTEEAGAAQVAVEADDLRRIQQEECPVPEGPAVQQLSADGAMVPLVNGKWAEVRTLTIGTVEQIMGKEGLEVHTHAISYFSRLCPAAVFLELATLPLHQRGTARAGTVVAVLDGAPWLQELVDAHRPDAVRILDFPHAAEYLSEAAQACLGSGTQQTSAWLDVWLSELKAGTPEVVLAAVRALPVPTPEAVATKAKVIRYLQPRLAQLRYAAFQAQGYPLGSGMVESGNKLVVEARLKGAGMHWERRNVNPMVALRGILCSDRWEQAWERIWGQLRRQVAARRRKRREQHHAAAASPPPPAAAPAPDRPPRPKLVVDGRPTADHPWSKDYDQRLLAKAGAKL